LDLAYDLCNTTFAEMIDAHLELNGGFEANKKIDLLVERDIPLLECDEAAMAVRNSGLTLEDMVPQHLPPKPPCMYRLFSLLHTKVPFLHNGSIFAPLLILTWCRNPPPNPSESASVWGQTTWHMQQPSHPPLQQHPPRPGHKGRKRKAPNIPLALWNRTSSAVKMQLYNHLGQVFPDERIIDFHVSEESNWATLHDSIESAAILSTILSWNFVFRIDPLVADLVFLHLASLLLTPFSSLNKYRL
jgi:hypothetical protein